MRQARHVSKSRGQGMTEYIIIVALIAIAAIGVFTYFGKTARHQVAGMAQELAGQGAASKTEIGLAGTEAGKATTAAGTPKGLANYADQNGQTK